MNLVSIANRLREETAGLSFGPPVAFVYRPLVYAWEPHRLYLERYGRGEREILLVGMNPGPFGMAQTGVPFGDVAMVRDFLRIEAPVATPAQGHPKRPVLGFACPRSEVSGTRFWGFARDRFGTAERFFRRFFVANFCPLAFVAASGANLTPDRLPAREKGPLSAACDRALVATVEVLRPRLVVGVGRFAAARAEAALAGKDLRIGSIPHPSPASPAANAGWDALAASAFARLGVAIPARGAGAPAT